VLSISDAGAELNLQSMQRPNFLVTNVWQHHFLALLLVQQKVSSATTVLPGSGTLNSADQTGSGALTMYSPIYNLKYFYRHIKVIQ
jgi:hypothetical protein